MLNRGLSCPLKGAGRVSYEYFRVQLNKDILHATVTGIIRLVRLVYRKNIEELSPSIVIYWTHDFEKHLVAASTKWPKYSLLFICKL